MRRTAWATLPGATWRARAVKGLFAGALLLGGSRIIAQPYSSPLEGMTPDTWRALLASLESAAPGKVSEAVLVHSGPSRPDRYYLHLFDSAGARTSFAKLSRLSDLAALERERTATEEIAHRHPRAFAVPRLLGAGAEGPFEWLLYEALPLRARPLPARWTSALQLIQEEIAGPIRRLDSVQQFPWWARFLERSSELELVRDALLEDVQPVSSVAAHGDFVNWNIHRASGKTWVLDWESFSGDAPLVSDPLRFFLGVNTRRAMRHPARVASEVHETFCVQRGLPLREVLAALAFLHERSVNTATAVARAFNPELLRAS